VTDYAIFMLDPDGVVTSWNAGAQRFKGYEESEILGLNFSRFYGEEDRARGLPAQALATAAREGRFEAEGWRIRKDGSRFWAHVILGPVGDLIGFAKITRNLTERRAADETLRRSEQQFRLLVQGVTDYALYMLDSGGVITNWNFGAQRIKGYRPEEIIGQHFSRFYSADDLAAGEPGRALEVAAREGRFEKEAWRIRKDGTRFWAHVVIDAIRDESGEVIGFAKITRDVTERKEAQQALEQAREALFQSQKMEAIGQLTGGIAHDFNNLLMAVISSLELIERRLPDDPRLAALFANAMYGSRRGTSLTQRMLVFARRQQLNPVPVDLPTLVRGMAGLLQRSLGPGIVIDTRFPLALPLVEADPNHVESALLNLVVNSRDAMPEGGSIIVSAQVERVATTGAAGPAQGDYVALRVTDTGHGMDQATLARATEPFFTTKGVGKGTGLGLSMVHGMAEQSGGRLLLRSEPGEGTIAEIWLPLAKAGPETAAEDVAAPAVAAERRRVILAVDDDPLILFNTVSMLEELGHEPLQAGSAREALEVLRSRKGIDLVITDHAMSQTTGAELVGLMRAEWPGLPVVVATGYAELPAGFGTVLPVLAKPYDLRDLARAIAEAAG
jgi:PAS domain S-box-containing protein